MAAGRAHVAHSRPVFGPDDERAVLRTLRSGQVAAGPEVERFEGEVARRLGLRGGVATSSGTAALHLVLLALGVGRGDGVVIPSYVCGALLQAVRFVGAVPRLADLAEGRFHPGPEEIDRAADRRTRAVLFPHPFGEPVDLSGVRALGLPLVEDLAQSLGARRGKDPAGRARRAAVCSFYATKMAAAGEGGMVVSDRAGILRVARDLRAYDEPPDARLRFNYKMSDLHAALGRSQLKKLESFIRRRRRIAARYHRAFRDLPLLLPADPPGGRHVYHRYVVRVTGKPGGAGVLRFLQGRGVIARRPVHRPVHRILGVKGFPRTDAAVREAVSIPCYPALGDGEVMRVIEAVRAAFGASGKG
ncbi:MAG: DegT/DnrJ/EryC1/StrS aminotransferase family protein [Nitrospinota bacterium]|jgi:perosamine synthetase|nr:DegT/DnrJ/EryC1/StrS aminotransferase family protein [Nitrospinota bacterium]HJM43629.1 DegT/DnrJ/EryC1/StrS aminotransferase family protein [Nitrospinota bacterium]